MIRDWPYDLDYAVTLHTNRLRKWLKPRLDRGGKRPEIWSNKKADQGCTAPYRTDGVVSDWGGSSGLLSIRVARHLGYDKIVLAGVPMDEKFSHYHNSSPWNAANSFRAAWAPRRTALRPYVRSMSGWTKKQFGEPTPQWVREPPNETVDFSTPPNPPVDAHAVPIRRAPNARTRKPV